MATNAERQKRFREGRAAAAQAAANKSDDLRAEIAALQEQADVLRATVAELMAQKDAAFRERDKAKIEAVLESLKLDALRQSIIDEHVRRTQDLLEEQAESDGDFEEARARWVVQYWKRRRAKEAGQRSMASHKPAARPRTSTLT